MCEMPNHLQAIIRELESWVWVRGFPALASHLATAGTIGTQEGLGLPLSAVLMVLW